MEINNKYVENMRVNLERYGLAVPIEEILNDYRFRISIINYVKSEVARGGTVETVKTKVDELLQNPQITFRLKNQITEKLTTDNILKIAEMNKEEFSQYVYNSIVEIQSVSNIDDNLREFLNDNSSTDNLLLEKLESFKLTRWKKELELHENLPKTKIEEIVEWKGVSPTLYMVLDTETNSFYSKSRDNTGAPIQISYVVTDLENIIDKDSFYITQPFIDSGAEGCHQISMNKLDSLEPLDWISANERVKTVLDKYKGIIIAGHNINFDIRVLEVLNGQSTRTKYKTGESVKTINNLSYCTLKEAKKDYPGLSGYKLGDMLEFFDYTEEEILEKTNEIFGDAGIGAHDARFDVIATMEVMKSLKERDN